MSSNRRKVFVSNVLKRLYPEEDNCEDSTSRLLPANLPLEEKAKTTSSQKDTEQIQVVFPPDEEKKLLTSKIYTVLPPPEGYVPSSGPECKCSSPSDDSGDDEDMGEGNMVQKRRRRKKNRNVTNSLNPETEMNSTQAETPAADRSTISKSKKRKLQRKRQKERKKAARTDACDTDPQNNDSKGDNTVKSPGETASEEDQREKAKDLLEFLQATQEIYFTDRSTSSSASIHVILEILDIMETGDFPSSDVILLHHIKTLLLLQDIDGSEEALANFKENSSLPADQRSTICSLFRYWIAHILPLQSKE